MSDTLERLLRIPQPTSLMDVKRRLEDFSEIDTVRYLEIGTDKVYVALYSSVTVQGFGGMVLKSSDLNELRADYPGIRFVHGGG